MTAMTENDVVEWYVTAKPGDRLTYHVGDLAYDRMKLQGDGQDLSHMADYIWQMAAEGKIELIRYRPAVVILEDVKIPPPPIVHYLAQKRRDIEPKLYLLDYGVRDRKSKRAKRPLVPAPQLEPAA